MRTPYNPKQSPRVIIIQKLYGKFFNDDADVIFSKHRFKKFIKDVFEFLYKPKIATKIIIKEYLNASNFFLEDSQTKYLNAILDKIAKKIRTSNE